MHKKKLKSISACILILLFSLSYFSIFSNLHIHNLGNNYYIVHAHPFDKSHNNNFPIETHQHSNKELLVINLTSIIEVITILFGIAIIFEKLIIFLSKISYNFIPTFFSYKLPVLRAPPIH